LISFKFKGDGTWSYESNETEEELRVVVPLADGGLAEIEHLGVHEAKKTLGAMTCPSGCNKGSIKYMLEIKLCLAKYDTSWETKQAKHVVHVRETICTEGILWAVCGICLV
jgi:hypothetical protein